MTARDLQEKALREIQRLGQEYDAAPERLSYATADRETLQRARAYVLDRIKRAVLTLAVSPDREKIWLKACERSSMPEAVQSINDAYGYESQRSVKFRPTARDVDLCLPTYAWLTWLQNQNDGKRDYKLIVSWAHGVPAWKLAQRYSRSDRTIQSWRSGAVDTILHQFYAEIMQDMTDKEAA